MPGPVELDNRKRKKKIGGKREKEPIARDTKEMQNFI